EPARAVAEELARAELAEALGFDDVWVPEQHFSPYCLAGDALLLAGHLAARTRRVRIGTAVVNLTFTHPLRFAERVALLDHVSGGRVEVGVGRGYQFPQYGVFGVPIDETRAIFDEALDVVLHAWRSSGTWPSSSTSPRPPRPRCRAATSSTSGGADGYRSTPTRTGSSTCSSSTSRAGAPRRSRGSATPGWSGCCSGWGRAACHTTSSSA